MTTAAERYAEMVRATDMARETEPRSGASREGGESQGGDRWSAGAERFREDPFRENETLTALLSFLQPDDVVLDIGGGAGRYLPLALRCREVINVEPSPGMGAQYEAAAREANISNARWLHSDWLGADIEGDVCFTANVVYYIEDIVPFVQKLDAVARRRVMIVMHSIPPTNVGAPITRLVQGREPAPAPGFKELLPVLWDSGILPEVRVLGPSDFIAERARFAGREEAIASVLPRSDTVPDARGNIEAHFDEIFVPSGAGSGYMRRRAPSRVLLITWEPQRR
jgi:hypothetical protein